MKVFFPIAMTSVAAFAGCQVKPYAPPPQKALVEEVEVSLQDFHGRPEAFAKVKGRLTSSAAQLVDAEQTREGQIIHVAVMEQTPRGASLLPDITASPPFETKIQLDLLGLAPGKYTLMVNGIAAELEIPKLQATTSTQGAIASVGSPDPSLPNVLVPIEDTIYGNAAVSQP